jgi:hypothetical protein
LSDSSISRAVSLAAVALVLPPCPGCAGGGEVNGLTCRECDGSTRIGRLPRRRLRSLLAGLLDSAATPAGAAVGTALRWSASLPGLLGAAGTSYGVAAVVHSVFRQVPEVPVVVLVAGVFALALDRRL